MLTVTIHATISRQSIYISTKDSLRCLLKAVLKMLWRPNLLSEQDSKTQWDPNIAGGCSSLCETHVLKYACWLWIHCSRNSCLDLKWALQKTAILKIQGCSQNFWKNRAVIALSHSNTSLCPYYDLTLYQANWWYKSSSPHLGSHVCVWFCLALSLLWLKYLLF